MVRVVLVGDSQLTVRPHEGPPSSVCGCDDVATRSKHSPSADDTRTALICASVAAPADWTIFCFGANDAAPWKHVPLAEFAANEQALVRRATSPSDVVGRPRERTVVVMDEASRSLGRSSTNGHPPLRLAPYAVGRT